jgi:hypothetical protein
MHEPFIESHPSAELKNIFLGSKQRKLLGVHANRCNSSPDLEVQFGMIELGIIESYVSRSFDNSFDH